MAGKPSEIQTLKALLEDERNWVSIGQILQVGLATDLSTYRLKVRLLLDNREVVAKAVFQPGASLRYEPGDLVLVVFADGNDDLGFVIGRMSTKTDAIASQYAAGDNVLAALEGKKLHLVSQQRINIGLGGSSEPAEPLLLGLVVKQLWSDVLAQLKTLCDDIASHTHVSNGPGFPTQAPLNAGSFTSSGGVFNGKKSSPVDDGTIHSDISFTEKG